MGSSYYFLHCAPDSPESLSQVHDVSYITVGFPQHRWTNIVSKIPSNRDPLSPKAIATNDAELLTAISNRVKRTLESQSAGHGWDHIDRVHQLAGKIQSAEGGNSKVISLAAILHDVGDAKFNQGVELSGKIASQILNEFDVDETETSHIIQIIENISFRKRAEAEPLTLEGQIVQDADRIDALGAIGIVRTIEYGQFKGQPFYAIDSPDAPSGVQHFYDKLFRIPSLLNTKTAKKHAEARVLFMQAFLRQYFIEINVEVPDWVEQGAEPFMF